MWIGASVVSFGVVACVLLFPAQPNRSGESVADPPPADPAGIFEGRTPCDEIANGFTGFPAGNCEKIKWELVLNTDPSTGAPTTFVYRGTRTTREGRWSVERGTPFDGDAVVYRLQPAGPQPVLELLAVDGQVLLLLDADRRVLVGNASWSHALNRVEAVPTQRIDAAEKATKRPRRFRGNTDDAPSIGAADRARRLLGSMSAESATDHSAGAGAWHIVRPENER